MNSSNFAVFTPEMKKDYTILVPTMLPMHFKIMEAILNSYGYKAVLLENTGSSVKDCGLKYVHNDTCYPALLVIGQLIDAIQSGKYDPHKVARSYPRPAAAAVPPTISPCCARRCRKPDTSTSPFSRST